MIRARRRGWASGRISTAGPEPQSVRPGRRRQEGVAEDLLDPGSLQEHLLAKRLHHRRVAAEIDPATREAREVAQENFIERPGLDAVPAAVPLGAGDIPELRGRPLQLPERL